MEPRKKVINIAKGIEVEQYRNRKKGTVVHIGKDVGKEVKSVSLGHKNKDFTVGLPGTNIKLYGTARKRLLTKKMKTILFAIVVAVVVGVLIYYRVLV